MRRWSALFVLLAAWNLTGAIASDGAYQFTLGAVALASFTFAVRLWRTA